MKSFLTLCAAILLFTQIPITAHVIAAPPQEEPTLTPNIMPSFKGGDLHLFRAWFNSVAVYPKKALEKNIDGDVEASFIIEKNGKLTNIEILVSPDELFSNEVIRALKKSPQWTPGTVNRIPVRTRLTMPFTLLRADEPQFLSTDGKKVDVMPKFEGGDVNKFTKWVMSKVVFQNLTGFSGQYNLRIMFVVDETGCVTDVNIIDTNSFSLSEQVVEIIKRSPQWTPGLKDGKPVSVALPFTVTITSSVRSVSVVERPVSSGYNRPNF